MNTLKQALEITLNTLTKEELIKQYLQLEDEFSKKDNDRKLHDQIEEYQNVFYQILADFKSIRSVLFMQDHYIQNNKKELNRDMLSGGIDSLRNSINYIENEIVDRTGIYN